MTLQEEFIEKWDKAEFGVKTRMKDLHGSTTIDYIVRTCRKGTYTKEHHLADIVISLMDIAKETALEAQEMYEQIKSINQ